MAEPGNKSDMAETKDSAIKLFGMTISLQTEQAEEEEEEGSSSIHAKLDVTEKEEKSGLGFDDVKGPPVSKVENQHDDMKEEEDEEEEREEKFAKPDKILPCPRCNSFETKFCYFNNYNVNQPRHFCRNCQRYWTAGGTMRNVPIGAGRRRNKLLRIHDSTLIRSANSETTHLTPIVNFSHREAKEEDHTHTTNHVVPVPVAPFVYQCNQILDTSNNPNRIQTNGIIPFQFVPMPCWVWTLGGGNRNMQQPVVGFDNMGLDKNGSSRLGKHSRDDFFEEKQHSMLGFKTPRRAHEP